ncbi:hypothetical protein BJ912DRAFT_200016 [Pholiota molesta]|nr:hypothetical protein BJ912DRAFT_200016 [Pholiota molesta]
MLWPSTGPLPSIFMGTSVLSIARLLCYLATSGEPHNHCATSLMGVLTSVLAACVRLWLIFCPYESASVPPF